MAQYRQVTPSYTHRHTHTSPVDSRHQIEVWEDNAGHRYFLPMYSRTGRTWANYRSEGQAVACMSYASAMKHIRGGQR